MYHSSKPESGHPKKPNGPPQEVRHSNPPRHRCQQQINREYCSMLPPPGHLASIVSPMQVQSSSLRQQIEAEMRRCSRGTKLTVANSTISHVEKHLAELFKLNASHPCHPYHKKSQRIQEMLRGPRPPKSDDTDSDSSSNTDTMAKPMTATQSTKEQVRADGMIIVDGAIYFDQPRIMCRNMPLLKMASTTAAVKDWFSIW